MNEQQLEASNQILKMLLSDDRGFCLVGGAGAGKSHTLKHVLNSGIELANSYFNRHNLNRRWSVQLTGPTHKSVNVLQSIYDSVIPKLPYIYDSVIPKLSYLNPPCTIYSYLNLKPIHEQGESKLVKRDEFRLRFDEYTPHLLVIDEASMLPQRVLDYLFKIMENNQGMKVLFIFDHLQLSPPKSNSIPIQSYDIPIYELTKFMRSQDKNIESIVSYLRDVVRNNGIPNLDSLVINKNNFKDKLKDCIKTNKDNTVIVTYTNRATNEWNDYVHTLLGSSSKQSMILGESFEYIKDNHAYLIHSDSEVYVKTDAIVYKGHVIKCSITPAEERASELKLLASTAKKTGKWTEYYAYKNSTPDLRLPYARTAYKVQGDTFDNVFVDLKDIMSCNIKDVRNRLLYVACSRARKGLYILGE